MEKVIKVIALANHHNLISEIEEVGSADIGEPDCKLINPFIINTTSGKNVHAREMVVLAINFPPYPH